MRILPREDNFHAVANGLGLELDVFLVVTAQIPDFIEEGINNGPGAENIQNLTNGDWSDIAGIYAPACDEDGSNLAAHNVWVREKDDVLEMSVSFAHEMVHAAQAEALGIPTFYLMDQFFMKTLGYSGNPFEIEAEGLARQIVLGEGLVLFQKEVA